MDKNRDVLKKALPVLEEALTKVVSHSPHSEVKDAGQAQLQRIRHIQERFDEVMEHRNVSENEASAIRDNAEEVRRLVGDEDYLSALKHSHRTLVALPGEDDFPMSKTKPEPKPREEQREGAGPLCGDDDFPPGKPRK